MTEIHVRYTPWGILACIFCSITLLLLAMKFVIPLRALPVIVAKKNFSLPMTYFVIPLRYTETINSFIVCLIDRKRYEHELEKQMESCME